MTQEIYEVYAVKWIKLNTLVKFLFVLEKYQKP